MKITGEMLTKAMNKAVELEVFPPRLGGIYMPEKESKKHYTKNSMKMKDILDAAF